MTQVRVDNICRKSRMSFKTESHIAGYLFIALPIIGFMCFTLIPLCFSIFVSFNSYDFFTKEFSWVGLSNFADAFHDPYFLSSLANTGIILLGLGIQIVVALLVAVLLTVNVKGQTIFRSFFFIPSLCSSVAVTLIWKWLFNVDFGVLNTILSWFGIPKIGWLTDKNIAIFSLMAQGIWMGIGGGMVMYIAALKNAPKSLYEAAEIDGANAVQKFFKITLPVISPTTFYILITTLIGNMTDFTRFKLMTDGGPYYSTTTAALYIYQVAFTSGYDYNYSYATALSWILSLIIIVLIGVIFLTSRKWVHYND